MKHITNFLLVLICSLLPAAGQYRDAGTDITVTDTRIERTGSQVALSFRVASQKHSLGRNYSAALQPVITDGESKVSFPAVIIQGKRAQILDSRHKWSSGQTADYPAVFARLLPGQQETYNAVVEYQPWMEGADLTLEKLVWGCCTSEAPESAVLLTQVLPAPPAPAPVVQRPAPAPEPKPTTGDLLSLTWPFVVRDTGSGTGVSDSDREGALVVYYRLNRKDIEPGFSDNRATLDDLTRVVKDIMASNDTRITRIVIGGFASPEGILTSNEALARDRAAAVRDYMVETTGIDDALIYVHNGAEDWYGLRLLIEGSTEAWKARALDILNETSTLPYESRRKERLEKLRALDGGSAYRYMVQNFFPKLRNGALIRVYYDDAQSER